MDERNTSPSILIVDDNVDFQAMLADLARLEGFHVTCARTLAEAREALLAATYDLLMIDIALPDGDGLDLLADVDLASNGQIAIVTGNPTVDSAIRAVRAPVVDYLIKPIAPDVLKALLERARTHPQRRSVDVESARHGMLGDSPAMQEVIAQIRRVAPLDITVLIHGESGTGKELAARAIHDLSGRGGRFIAVNCGAVSTDLLGSQLFGHERGSFTGAVQSHAGYFEQAQGGTLFLDEVTEMPAALQVFLLRVLESRVITRIGGAKEIPVDVRIVAATNREPEQAVKKGMLREDLFYRLLDFPMRLPALRERRSDIPVMAQAFLDRLNSRYGTRRHFSKEALAALAGEPWPGNVRQLRHTVQQAYILATGDVVEPRPYKPPQPAEESDGSVRFRVGMRLEDVEREMLLRTLAHCGNNKRRAARILGITARTIYNRLAHYRSLGLVGDEVVAGGDEDEALD